MEKKIAILGIVGSLRKGSYNKALMRSAVESCPPDATIEVFDIGGMPLFSEDWEKTPPPVVTEFKKKIRAAHAILIATPEYNYSIPGVLKNAIDCGSRPYGDNAFDGKPVAVMGASVGMLGTAHAQYHLRQCFVPLNMRPLNMPEVMVPFAQDKVDAGGKVTDPKTCDKVKELVVALIDWTKRMEKAMA